MSQNFYQPRGKVPPVAYSLAIASLLIALPLLASVYSLLIWYIPFLYLNFIITAGFGVLLAWSLNNVLKIGKVRNRKFAMYLALITGLLAIYFVWTSYITLLYNAGDLLSSNITSGKYKGLAITKTFFNIGDFLNINLSPGLIPATMSYLYDVGSWGIKSFTVKGFILGLVWFLEAAIIFLIVIGGGRDQAEEPFSEKGNVWFEKNTLPYYIKLPEDIDKFKEDMSNGNLAALQSLESDTPHSMNYGQITAFSDPNEPNVFMNFVDVKVSFDKNGKESTDSTVLFKNVKVTMNDLNLLQEKFS